MTTSINDSKEYIETEYNKKMNELYKSLDKIENFAKNKFVVMHGGKVMICTEFKDEDGYFDLKRQIVKPG